MEQAELEEHLDDAVAQMLMDRIDKRKAVTGRECGECNLCCKVIDIDVEEFRKPYNQWCQHAKPRRGCGIYPERPMVCRTWACQWLTDPTFVEEWYPLNSKMVISPMIQVEGKPLEVEIHVDPGRPGIWREEPWHSQIIAWSRSMLLANAGLLRVYVGNKGWIVLPNGEVPVPEAGSAYSVLRVGVDAWHVFNFGEDHERAMKFKAYTDAVVDWAKGASPEEKAAVLREMGMPPIRRQG